MVNVSAVLVSILLTFQGPTLEELDKYREQHRQLLDALAMVESGNNPDAIGDSGMALGTYQIWNIYWFDAVERCSALKQNKYRDVTENEYAERVMISYWLRYCKVALESGNLERLSRVHNGGPRGHKKRATVPYWNKVQAQLERQKSSKDKD
jgi:hypothetical protein